MQRIIVVQPVKKFPSFKETKKLLSCSQKSAIKHYPDPTPSIPRLYSVSLTCSFISYSHLHMSPLHATCSVHLIRLDLISLLKCREGRKLWRFSLHNPLPSSYYFLFLNFKYSPSTMFSNSFNLCLYSSVIKRDQILHPYRTRGTLITLDIFNSNFSDVIRECNVLGTQL
jgi:hypothetical protein